jgi:hypothetical protein
VSDHSDQERAIDALLLALATQAAERDDRQFSPAALGHIIDQGRATVTLLLGSIGHLVHYDSTGEDNAYAWLADLFEQLIAALRSSHRESHGLLPGDVVDVVVALPDQHLKAGDLMRVYWVGDDGTVDVGYESLVEDYVISTVRITDIGRRSPQ